MHCPVFTIEIEDRAMPALEKLSLALDRLAIAVREGVLDDETRALVERAMAAVEEFVSSDHFLTVSSA